MYSTTRYSLVTCWCLNRCRMTSPPRSAPSRSAMHLSQPSPHQISPLPTIGSHFAHSIPPPSWHISPSIHVRCILHRASDVYYRLATPHHDSLRSPGPLLRPHLHDIPDLTAPHPNQLASHTTTFSFAISRYHLQMFADSNVAEYT